MSAKRGIVSWILWVVFALLECAMLSVYLIQCVIATYTDNTYVTVAIVCGVFALLLGLFLLCRFLVRNVQEHPESKARNVWGIVLPILVLVLTGVLMFLTLAGDEVITIENTAYYRNALVDGEAFSVSFIDHGLSYAYQWLLHVTFVIFGNQAFVGVMLQVVLFFLTLVFMYLGLRKIAGIVPATLSCLALVLLVTPSSYCFLLTPEMLGAFVFALLLFSCACIAEFFERFGYEHVVSYLPVVLIGMLIGGAIYLDLIFAVFLFFVFGLFLVKEGHEAHCQVGFLLLAQLIGVGLVFGIITAVFYANGMEPIAYLERMMVSYTEDIGLMKTLFAPDLSTYGSLGLLCCAFFLVPAQVLLHRQRSAVFVAILITLTAMLTFGFGMMDYQLLYTMVWCILASIGLQMLFVSDADPEEEPVYAGQTQKKDVEIMEVDDLPADDLPADDLPADNLSADDLPVENLPGEEATEPTENVAETTADAPIAAGAPLPNPLKGPKKHRKKELRYAYEISEEQMHYDLEIDEGDDFDH